ncbi:MAG: phosphoribosylamine--glycine ligase [Candidatus Tectomicrobia bacterium]|nr:phosphoribosylamine--glycine ligase [Candidatus Tectomicrobia bacterium]
MKVLVVGNGGREHALVWKLAQSPHLEALYCAPGNAGSHRLAEPVPIAEDDISGLCRFAREQRIDLTVVGPEIPLALGISDTFAEHGLHVFGPSRAAAQLEASKSFAKTFMWEHGIPTAAAEICETIDAAQAYIHRHGGPLVVKADGLAAGKGVTVCRTQEEALHAVHQAMVERVFGDAGDRVLLEDFLSGEEASFHALVDGEHIVPLPSSQDHKRAFDHDTGPNTGGMGAYSPAPVITEAMQARILSDIVEPVVRGMAARGTPYRGVLYTGLMIVEDNPYVVEFNVRFGDPETQPLMVRLADDLLPWLHGAARGCLQSGQIAVTPQAAICVAMVSQGYPGSYAKGLPISGLEEVAQWHDTWVFHAGTSLQDNRISTNGGRVLGVTARGETIAAAIEQAYQAVRCIHWPGVHYRRDIGHRAMQHLTS